MAISRAYSDTSARELTAKPRSRLGGPRPTGPATVRDSWLEHDGYFVHNPFPTRRVGREFVGQPFDEHDRPLIEGPSWLRERLTVLHLRRDRVGRLASGARRLVRKALAR